MRILTAQAIHDATACYVMHERAWKGRNLQGLAWMVGTHTFLYRCFSLLILDRLRKNEQKINKESKNVTEKCETTATECRSG